MSRHALTNLLLGQSREMLPFAPPHQQIISPGSVPRLFLGIPLPLFRRGLLTVRVYVRVSSTPKSPLPLEAIGWPPRNEGGGDGGNGDVGRDGYNDGVTVFVDVISNAFSLLSVFLLSVYLSIPIHHPLSCET